jgi:hypothetical protein
LITTDPSGAEGSVVATTDMFAVAPAGRLLNVTERSLLVPPQTPLLVDWHETNFTAAGKTSFTVTEGTALVPFFVTTRS